MQFLWHKEILREEKMVAPPRLELGHPCERRILNPLRLPFRQGATLIAVPRTGVVSSL